MVTSSAVVGSSAISKVGLQAMASAIITRWRMPPDSWCGYSCRRWAAAGISTSSSMRWAWARAAVRSSPRCRRTDSAICSPTVKTGFRLVMGSWKIMAISLPRMRRMARSGSASKSMVWPARLVNRAWPLTCVEAVRDKRRIKVRLVTDLPEPDSPTRAVVWPGRMLKLTSATERIKPSSVSKKVLRWRTSSRKESAGFRGEFMSQVSVRSDRLSHRLLEPGVQQIAHAVAQQLQGQRGQDDGQAGKQDNPQGFVRILLAAGHHGAPGRDLGRHAD